MVSNWGSIPLCPSKKEGRNRRGALTFASLNIKGGRSIPTCIKWYELC